MLQQRAIPKESPLQLLVPALTHLAGYVAALERGWSPDNVRAARLPPTRSSRASPRTASASSRASSTARRRAIRSRCRTARRPAAAGLSRWIWDGEFCGSIGFRWQRGTEALPPHCLGHIGYAVVPWKQNRGYATPALRCCCRRPAAKASPTSSSRPIPTTSPRRRSSRPMAARWSSDSARPSLRRCGGPAVPYSPGECAAGPHDGLDHRRQRRQPMGLERAPRILSPSWPSRTRVMKPCTEAQANRPCAPSPRRKPAG